MKNSNDTIGNQTCDLPACSTVPQPTAPLCTPYLGVPNSNILRAVLWFFLVSSDKHSDFYCHVELINHKVHTPYRYQNAWYNDKNY